ncbi:myosin family protein with dil domain [Chrysochromulina tobinii]|uniref:Myosin family protein with dil domain n=1 Tax=Chrysochromulina tobinii TaxID=1460289 RepID=A0A0M0J5M6_9EUKA|nr:myosin family protein with dil domain [Chrysochromulina tobinii]|eukprot:KOO21906.1 myosin family protein with dil domain [Chrysochromulina sp. CCMP291]
MPAIIPDGAAVWIKDTNKDSVEPFVKAKVVKYTEGRGYTMFTSDGKEKIVRPVDCAQANPDGMSAPDNCYLIHISESTILANMKARFANKLIYTYTSNILIVLNPFQPLPIYGNDKMQPYVSKPLGIAEPHTYAMGEEAYKTLVKTQRNQALVVSGESGAGKTETNKHLMTFLAWRSKSETVGNDIAQVMLLANPVLEAVGNAKTMRNNNSSRFGKFVKIAMSERGGVLGAVTNKYLLEKSRVPFQSAGERNYHVFYQLVAGHKGKAALALDKGASSFHYLNQSGTTEVKGVNDAADFERLCSAMASTNMGGSDQEDIFKLFAALLHLGNIKFNPGSDEASISSATSAALAKGGRALPARRHPPDRRLPMSASLIARAIPASSQVSNLQKCLCERTMTTMGETIATKQTPAKAALARDALAKSCYARLFDFIVERINLSMRGAAKETSTFIGLLDVYGFESFAINTYEQLCINFANEKLQQFFLRFVFKAEEDLYRSENVAWTKIEYQDNQGCIDLIEKMPTGVMRLLDETCKKPKVEDSAFCLSVAETLRRNDFFMDARGAGHKNYRPDEAFAIRHFAGDVCYVGEGFCDKNNDTLHSDFVALCSGSGHGVLRQLFAEDAKVKKANTFNSVSRRFINDLNTLMEDLNSTKAHFIRCIKPNKELEAFKFTPSLVLTQLRCSGTIDAVQLMAGAYPTRIPYDSIYSRYASQMPDFVRKLEPPLFCEALALALEISNKHFALGRTKIFFKAGKGQVLEELAERDLTEVIPVLVAKIKQWEVKKKMQVRLQAYARMFIWRRYFKRAHVAVRTVQHRARGRKIRIEYRKRHLAGATIGFIAPDGVAARDSRLRVGDMIRGVNGVTCGTYDEVINVIRASGATVKLTISRKPVTKLLETNMHMELGASSQRTWDEFTFRLYSNRVLTFEKTEPPVVTGEIDVRLALEVRMVDAPNGGGFLEIETASKTFILRSGDTDVLNKWRRELYELLPYLRATEVKCGWLLKKGETSSAGFKPRYCVLFSSYRLLYFDSEACTKRKGAVDLSVAQSVESITTAKGPGFEISTPGRTWVFAACESDAKSTASETTAWMDTLRTMLGDIRERKRKQQISEGVMLLKEGWADLKDESGGGEGAWVGHWFALNSAGELRIFPDAESTQEQMVLSVDLKLIERVERSKGMDYYDFCIDLCFSDKTIKMRPIDRGDMQAWLGVLQTQLASKRENTDKGSVITMLHQGWIEKRSERGKGSDAWKKRYFVLCTKQEKEGDELAIHHLLYYFKSEESAGDVSEANGCIDLGEVEEVKKCENRLIDLVTESRVWQLRAESNSDQEIWVRQIQSNVGDEAVKSGAPGGGSKDQLKAAAGVVSIAKAEMKMQVPGLDGQACWKSAKFDLQSDGVLRWSSNEAPPWDAGAIDIKKALGVWLLGPAGWRRLDIILPDHRWTLAADDDNLLQKWIKLLENAAPEKPVSEIRNGWMEKKGAMGGGWKVRFFVLLSTHELLYFESDRSPKCKGVIDLKEATQCTRVASPDYNYEFAFEVGSPKRTWILCPDDEHSMKEWMADIKQLLGKAGQAKENKKRASVHQHGNRTYNTEGVGEDGGSAAQGNGSTPSLKAGWLMKKGEVNTAWKNRYFVLKPENKFRDQPKTLWYYKDQDTARMGKNGSMIEVEASASIQKESVEEAGKSFAFAIVTPTRKYCLCAVSAAEQQEWITMLQKPSQNEEVLDARATSFAASGPLVEVHSGWLRKKGQGLFGTMHKRYFVLYDNKELHYFTGESMENIQRKGRIKVADISCLERLKPGNTKDFTFCIKEPSRDWILDPLSGASLEEWTSKLKPMLPNSSKIVNL